MGFVWAEVISIGTAIKASHFTEMKTNVESLYTDLGKDFNPGCGADFPVPWNPEGIGPTILNQDHDDVRDRIDFLEDKTCGTHNATNHSGYHTTYNVGYDASNYIDDDAGDHTTFNNSHLIIYYAMHDESYYMDDDSAFNGAENANYHNTYYVTDQATDHNSYDNIYYTIDNSSYKHGAG